MGDTAVLCDDRAAQCRCVLDVGHHGPHACTDQCGGQWTYDDDGNFVPVVWPLIGRVGL